MKTSRSLSVVGLMMLLFAAYGLSQNTQTQYDHNANFAKYHTFSWEKVKVSDPVWQARMQDSVDRTLRAKGWHEVKTGGDVAITAVGSDHVQDYGTFYHELSAQGITSSTDIQNLPVGSLVLDFYDSNTKQLVWRGVAKDALTNNNPNKNERTLDTTIDQMLGSFPPRQ